MGAARQLSLLDPRPARAHDLPPLWDGRRVEWDSDWGPALHIFLCPPRAHHDRGCPRCRSTRPGLTKRARVRVDDVVSLYWLTAYRCLDCGHDQVLDNTGALYDLEDDDYSDAGSYLNAPHPFDH